MRTPTITKKQAIEAMIEQARRDWRTARDEHRQKVIEAEEHLHILVRALLNGLVLLPQH